MENTKIPTGATGITSTYVENTFSILRHNGLDKDHLHIRGEYYFLQKIGSGNKGSPPHTWRIPESKKVYPSQLRITSTYVENTDSYVIVKILLKGSPPHTWRIQVELVELEVVDRITSKYVENT